LSAREAPFGDRLAYRFVRIRQARHQAQQILSLIADLVS
jgi:hypothetical protein